MHEPNSALHTQLNFATPGGSIVQVHIVRPMSLEQPLLDHE